jgi:prepilin-type N-terminal cleavage/methylation domain-containing protein
LVNSKQSGYLPVFARLGGFTLVEILLVIALIGVMGGLVMGGLGGFFQAGKVHPPERRLQEAVLKARALAERESIPVFLSYERKAGGRFIVEGAGRLELLLDERNQTNADLGPEISFSAIVENSPYNYTAEQLRLLKIKFMAGCSPAFLVRLETEESNQEITFDPFSAYALKEK